MTLYSVLVANEPLPTIDLTRVSLQRLPIKLCKTID